MLKKQNKNRSVVKLYKLFGTDVHGDFLYKKKINWQIYNNIVNLKLKKSFNIISKNLNSQKKKTNYFNSLLESKVKLHSIQTSKNNKYNLRYIYSLYVKRFKYYYNNISTNFIKKICLLNTKLYKYNYLSFFMLWERRLDTILHRLHIVDSMRLFKQQYIYSKSMFLINGKIINNFSYILKKNDLLTVNKCKLFSFLKYIYIKQKTQIEWLLVWKLYKRLKKRLVSRLHYLDSTSDLMSNLAKLLSNNLNLYQNIKLSNHFKADNNKLALVKKQKRPYRIANMKPLLYNVPCYTEVNWRNLSVVIVLNDINNARQIPYLNEFNIDCIYNLYKL